MVEGKRQKMSTLEISILQQVKKMTEKADLKALQFLTSLADSGDTSHHSSDTPPPSAGADDADLEILAYYRREQLLAKGLPQDMVEQILEELGLSPSSKENAP